MRWPSSLSLAASVPPQKPLPLARCITPEPVVDVHKDWCGPCRVMLPTFERIWMSTDDADQRILFRSADSAKFAALAEYAARASCKPVFLLYRGGHAIARVEGANSPEIVALCAEHTPKLPAA